jgi:hypothetical protein
VSQRIQLPDVRVAVEGAVDLDVSTTGVTPRRLANRWRFQFPIEVEFLASSPSGVRLAFTTDSPSIGLEVMATHFQLGEEPQPYWSTFDLVVDGQPVAHQETRTGNLLVIDLATRGMEFRPGEPATVTFDVPAGAGRVEVWLPSSSVVEVRSLTFDDGATIGAPPPDTRPKWVHHGSSISHCLEASGPAFTWPAVAARAANVNLTNLGLAGQCHLDQFTARTMRDLPADFLSLKCGINIVNGDTLRQRTFPSALHGFLDTVREGHPDTPLLVVSPIICPVAENTPGPTDGASGSVVALGTDVTHQQGALTLREVRNHVHDVVQARQSAGDKHLFYLNGLELFGEADVHHLPDGLHPDGEGYRTIGERFAATAFAPSGPFA